ncbi:choice-of-anchor D domain-containing protein [Vulgatibacter sp.]|uniref:choice-of-anchor D domain-containing protein n=1 Tax=Vulgatibacter sp. TaxID=1971226 RepID=UPI00356701B9
MKRLVVALFLALAAGGCSCGGEKTAVLESELAVSPASLAFGEVTIGATSDPKSFVVSNAGSGPLSVQVASNEAVFAVQPEGASVPPGGQATFEVTFSPEALKEITGTILVTSNAGEASITLSGEGIAASVVVSPKSGIDYGDVARDRLDTPKDDRTRAAPKETIRVTNAGNDVFEVLAAEVIESADGAFEGDLSGLLGTYAKAEAREAEVSFDPAVLGQLEGAVKITTNSPANPEFTIPLTGRGVAPVMKACSSFDDAPGEEVCTPELPNAGQGSASYPGWEFGFFPELQGRSGSLVIHNEGNIPLQITTFSYQPSSPDVRFWRNPERTDALPFGEFQPVICPAGVEDESCTHTSPMTVWVDYIARGSLCCRDGVLECTELAPEGDCSQMANSDVGQLNVLTNDKIWSSLSLVGRGRSQIGVANVGDYSGSRYQGDTVRVRISNVGGAVLTVDSLFLADPDDTSCGAAPCACGPTSGGSCAAFQIDPGLDLPFSLEPDEEGSVYLDYLDGEITTHEIDLYWLTDDPIQPLRQSVIHVVGNGTITE